MTQEEIEAKLAELELCISMQTEALGLLTKTVTELQDSLGLLVDKLTQTIRNVAQGAKK